MSGLNVLRLFLCVSLSKDLLDDGHVERILHTGAGADARGSLAQRRVDCKEIYLIMFILRLIIINIDYVEHSKSSPALNHRLAAGLKLTF